MVNYGYGPELDLNGWKESRKYKLAEALKQLLLDLKVTRNDEMDGQVMRHKYPEPYIEVDGLYSGIRIRKITDLSEKQLDELIEKADEIYNRIMGEKD